ncbi:MAG TPA: hypothetical protein VFK12_03775 [Gammaproteobacteria bacterium]|nr:hypothetical protein [Gammaproteobacteria bacterium]
MNNSADYENGFLERSRSIYASSLASLDQDVIARLRAARLRAVAEADRRQPLWQSRPWALPVGVSAMVVAAIVGSVLFWNQGQPNTVPFAAANNNDMAIVLSNDNLDMYADMDFYRWLQAQQQGQSETGQSGNDDNG